MQINTHLSSEDALLPSSNCCNESWLLAQASCYSPLAGFQIHQCHTSTTFCSSALLRSPNVWPLSCAAASLRASQESMCWIHIQFHKLQGTLQFLLSKPASEQQGRNTRQLCLQTAEWAIEATAAFSFGCAQLSTFPELASLCIVWTCSTSHSLRTTALLLSGNFNNTF